MVCLPYTPPPPNINHPETALISRPSTTEMGCLKRNYSAASSGHNNTGNNQKPN